MVRDLIEQAISYRGSQAKLAEACGIKQSSIWQAKESARCSAELAMQIEQATEGRVTARELRPDLPWPSPATQPQHQRDDDPDAHGDEGSAAATTEVIA